MHKKKIANITKSKNKKTKKNDNNGLNCRNDCKIENSWKKLNNQDRKKNTTLTDVDRVTKVVK